MVAVGSIVVVLAEVSVGVTASNIWKRSEKIVRLKVIFSIKYMGISYEFYQILITYFLSADIQ